MKPAVKMLIALLLAVDLILFAFVMSSFAGDGEAAYATEAAEVLAAVQTMPYVQTEASEETAVPVQTEPVQTQPPQTQPAETTAPTQPDEVFSLTFAGDCTFGSTTRTYYAQLGFVKTVGDDLGYPFRNVQDWFGEDDFTMVNLEGVLADRGIKSPKAYNFRGPAKYAGILTQGSVEAVTLANNHSMDYGEEGYASTISALQNEGVSYVESDGILLFTTQRGLEIGVYAMTYEEMSLEAMLAGIEKLKTEGAEVIVVAAHWGEELCYEVNDDQVWLAYAAIDAGAHIVYGSHPHVLQPIEEYNGGIIYYSMGNFSFGGNTAPTDMDTAILRQQVIRRSDGTIVLGEHFAIPACISSDPGKNNFQPTPYVPGSGEYCRVLEKLGISFE